MNTQPLVSAIVPSFNHERFVRQALESICGQDYRPLELIVIDDGSVDSSARVIEETLAAVGVGLDRVVFHRQANQGVAATMNRAIQEARGEYVLLSASDDTVLPGALSKLVSRIEALGPRWVVATGDAAYIDATGVRVFVDQAVRVWSAPGPNRFPTFVACHTRDRVGFDPQRDFGTHWSLYQGNYLPTGILVRRSAMLEAGLYDPRLLLQDLDLWLKLARRGRFHFEPAVLAEYRVHGNNSVTRMRPRLHRETLELRLRELPFCIASGREAEAYRPLAESLLVVRSWEHLLAVLRTKGVSLPRLLSATVLRGTEAGISMLAQLRSETN